MTALRACSWRRWLAALSLVGWITQAAGASVATISSAKDNTLFEDDVGSLSDGAGPTLFTGNNGQGLARRALLSFDVAAALPAGARVDSVRLAINVSNVSNNTTRTFTLHRVLLDWGEGTSSTSGGVGAPATVDDATWLHMRWPDRLWTTPGGDFDAAPSASLDIAGVGLYSCLAPRMASDVQSWLDDPGGNHGWLIQWDEVTLNTAKRLDSRENGIASQRPALIVYYDGLVGVGESRVRVETLLGPFAPNPARASTRLSLVLDRPARARVDLFDPAGRRIVTLLDGPTGAGRTDIEWDGRDATGSRVSPGLYLCRLVLEGRPREVARVSLIR